MISAGAGSGAVFFSGCPLHCRYCQNAAISEHQLGAEISVERLAEIFLELRFDRGAANINLVTPTHYVPWIVPAVREARRRGLDVPIVYNTSGYETADTIRSLDGIVDVYLTDFKYPPASVSDAGGRYSNAPDYHDEALPALDEMVAQVGPAAYGAVGASGACCGDAGAGDGPALVRGVVVRHLMLPGRLEDSKWIIAMLWERYANRALYSFMSQYTPMGAYPRFPELERSVTREEYESLLDFADSLGLDDYFWQEGGADRDSFIPSWDFEGVLRPAR